MESASGEGVLKGGKCWFAVESKTFEISIEVVRGKPRGIILEKSKGFFSWIRFREKSLSFLLEGVEAWCRGKSSSRHLKIWEEEGRKFRLECCSNEAGRFLLCLVRDVEAKKYCLILLKGKGLVGGWFLLAKKLRALGVSTPIFSKVYLGVPPSENEGCSVKGIGKGATYALRRESFSCKDEDLKWGVFGMRVMLRQFGDGREVIDEGKGGTHVGELLAIEEVNVGGSIPGQLKLTDEALLDEASSFASPIAERMAFQLEEGDGRKSGALAVLRSSETKIKEMNAGLVHSLGVGRHLDWRAVNLRGAVGVCNKDKEDFWEEFGSIKGVLLKLVSDHFPILLEGEGMKRKPSFFRFENMWLEDEGFKDQMKMWWGSLNFIGTFNFFRRIKLRALKDILKTWNKEVFGLIETKMGEAFRHVVYWDEMKNVQL
ncbi:hypothetical protein AAG906_003491 [Vitis piasezkii]